MANAEFSRPNLRWFRATFTTIGLLYVLLASSALVQGVAFLRDFGVDAALIASPVMADFFSFFYELMAVIGVLMILFGYVVTDLASQRLTARAFTVLMLLFMLRDLVTSDSRFGNHLYRGDRTLVFVLISAVFALAFGCLSFSRALSRASHDDDPR